MVGDGMEPVARNFNTDDLRSAIAGTRIEKTILVHATTTHDETYELLEIAESDSTVIAVVGWLQIDSPGAIAQCEKYLEAHGGSYLKGIRDVAQDLPDSNYLAKSQAIATVQQLGKMGLTYDILTKTPELPAAIELVKACPDVQFVLDHISKPYIAKEELQPWKSLISELASFDNVSCKISGMVNEAKWNIWKADDFAPYADHIIESFGPERLMFGSDWPVALLAAKSYSEVVHLAQTLTTQFTARENELFWRENALSAYKVTKL
ncbi:L-fuconolactonase [Candidatus Planktophila dulcis]|uniref:L-fuconolactonase n=2 Tax=Candidatus Planktophila dulcis TaxID=1884914 RepID=A0AAC9YTV1_9ACTN|nr:L-fuconolactonase [Candidatus Planktophila dulcis]